MTFKVWVEHDGTVDTLFIAGGGRRTYSRLCVDARRVAESMGWTRPIVTKMREVDSIDHTELPIQTWDFVKDMIEQGM